MRDVLPLMLYSVTPFRLREPNSLVYRRRGGKMPKPMASWDLLLDHWVGCMPLVGTLVEALGRPAKKEQHTLAWIHFPNRCNGRQLSD